MKRPIVLALALLLAGVVAALIVTKRAGDGRGEATTEPPRSFVPSTPSAAAFAEAVAAGDRATSDAAASDALATAPSSPNARGAAGREALALGSARQTVATQERLLRDRDDAAFRATFTPEIRAELTAEVIESCRKRLGRHSVVPDWDVAESSVEPDDAGKSHRVLRVSMWGKSMTGFHEVEPDVWLADAAWCVPIW